MVVTGSLGARSHPMPLRTTDPGPTFRILVAACLVLPAPNGPDDPHPLARRLRPDLPEDSLLAWRRLTADWGGARPDLEARGVHVEGTWTLDGSVPVTGGLRDRATGRGLLEVVATVDLERVLDLPRSRLAVGFQSQAGRDGSADAGDVQAYSNIDAPNQDQLSALWWESWSAGERVRVKLGKVDANTEFAHVDAGLPFLHSSPGFSPTIFVLPTYPDPATGAHLFVRPDDGWRVGLAAYDARNGGVVSGRRGLTAEFDETFLIGELERSWDGGGGGRLALGGWRHTGTFPRFDGGFEDGTDGWYAVLEQRLVHPDPVEGGHELTGFVQLGHAAPELTDFHRHLGLGVTCAGLIPEHDSWRTGLMVSVVELSGEPGALSGEEWAIELFQEVVLAPWIVVVPDLQLIVDPSGRRDLDDVLLATLRVQFVL